MKLEVVVLILLHGLGLASAVRVVMEDRSPQGAIAWALSLTVFPLVALPVYWVFGGRRFHGYVAARRRDDLNMFRHSKTLEAQLPPFLAPRETRVHSGLARIAYGSWLEGHRAGLLIDGKATFDAMFSAMERAEHTVWVQFFAIHNDQLGLAFCEQLAVCAGRGLTVLLLYDPMGSHQLSRRQLRLLADAGVRVASFSTVRGLGKRFQINFRNHRKLVIVDGETAFVGGHNVGDDYLGKNPELPFWRDTHCWVRGPAVACLELAFLEDWHWATGEILPFQPVVSRDANPGIKVLSLPTGPADDFAGCHLMFLDLIHNAVDRLWIATPYFVPDPAVIAALTLAAVRGVEVRVLLPERADHLAVYLSSYAYINELDGFGIKFYRYRPGFLHQKVVLVDDDLAAVGTANFDYRSFFLNFEITLLFHDRDFAEQVRLMLEADFARGRRVTAKSFRERPFWFRFAVSVARLFAPLQ
ncbi:cardiolipin synthase [Acanthopleuribacter pedis]|uniref:Cardiolipin synthase n=1 Tax=Acanthopleuribacter pedis TaxID=442870 RepID=A0A8J7U421_9BACT|nr:cardiolipin synthase [Acanthopleuribacter pedis]MBO1320192.1 cardiolipin synthase [Acanthopleuribacter pedis]